MPQHVVFNTDGKDNADDYNTLKEKYRNKKEEVKDLKNKYAKLNEDYNNLKIRSNNDDSLKEKELIDEINTLEREVIY